MGSLLSGEYVFVVVDYYSRYFEVDILKSVTSATIIGSLERIILALFILSFSNVKLISGKTKTIFVTPYH